MSEMLTKMAVAAVRFEMEQAGFPPTSQAWAEVANHPDIAIEQYAPLVAAMLGAMREATDEMCASGAVDYAVTSDIRRVWRGMIDVALTGQPSELARTGVVDV